MAEEYIVNRAEDPEVLEHKPSGALPGLSKQYAFEFEGLETEFNKKVQLAPAEIIEPDDL